jgi:hypothetical protein
MPLLPIVTFFATALGLFAAGSPLGAVPLMLGAVALSMKLGMRVKQDTDRLRPARVPAGQRRRAF